MFKAQTSIQRAYAPVRASKEAAANRVRHGKTKKDRESGATERAKMNMSLRTTFNQEAGGRSKVVFPKTACNGKKNHSRWTGKGGNTIIK